MWSTIMVLPQFWRASWIFNVTAKLFTSTPNSALTCPQAGAVFIQAVLQVSCFSRLESGHKACLTLTVVSWGVPLYILNYNNATSFSSNHLCTLAKFWGKTVIYDSASFLQNILKQMFNSCIVGRFDNELLALACWSAVHFASISHIQRCWVSSSLENSTFKNETVFRFTKSKLIMHPYTEAICATDTLI